MPFAEGGPDVPLVSLAHLDLDGFDRIVTHGAAGEYGHKHHVQVHDFIVGGWPDRHIVTTGGSRELRLNDAALDRKCRALRCYDHVLPYQGEPMPKWQALMRRYVESGFLDLAVEHYADHRP